MSNVKKVLDGGGLTPSPAPTTAATSTAMTQPAAGVRNVNGPKPMGTGQSVAAVVPTPLPAPIKSLSRTPTSTASTTTTQPVGRSASSRRPKGKGSDGGGGGVDAAEGEATIIRQATASSPTRTVKIGGLGSKLFKKCKSATFQIDGATYTIGKYMYIIKYMALASLYRHSLYTRWILFMS